MPGAGCALLLALLPIAAPPEDAPKPEPVKVWRKVIVEAIRNCPQPKEGEIVVCGKDIGEAPPAWRYPRLAHDPRDGRAIGGTGPVRPGSAAGAAGTGSCSAVGAGGTTGCAVSAADAWRAERRAAGDWP